MPPPPARPGIVGRSTLVRRNDEDLHSWIDRVASNVKTLFEPPYVIEVAVFHKGAPMVLFDQGGFIYGLASQLRRDSKDRVYLVNPAQVKAAVGRRRPRGPATASTKKNWIVQAAMEDIEGAQDLQAETKKRREALADAIYIAKAGIILFGEGSAG